MTTHKRKADDTARSNVADKRQNREATGLKERFLTGLFDKDTINSYAAEYAASGPYKHAVISGLINDDLLRSVRKEITDNIHFTPKETDIYKIHQSGDLANLDGLPEEALSKLPSLLKLRDALYGSEFRQWISQVSGAGLVSGRKTDMAVNVYVPGCHLLCHDDVIGSRRISYILYLTNPDIPWQAEWGGALRLYPTDDQKGDDGQMYKVPRPDWSKVIPPAWNQLSFFTVQPGESFHDVEEVYKREPGDDANDGDRIRMAISGWFHIPQEGEDGFEPGLEQKLADKSSLQQLQGKAEQFDRPQQNWLSLPETEASEADEEELSEADLEFLLQFMTPNYLTPDTVGELNELFADESMLQLSDFLNTKFAAQLKDHLGSTDTSTTRDFQTSGPPHKQRYHYLEPNLSAKPQNPFQRILDKLLPSTAFHKWLALVTGLTLGSRQRILARQFRRGLDYQLAQGFTGENVELEYTLSMTPTPGWGADDNQDEETKDASGESSQSKSNGKSAEEDEDNVGGYELYMAGDDDADEEDDDGEKQGNAKGSKPRDAVTVPQSQTGAGDRRSAKRKKADPAIYRAAADDEDDGILFSNPASWNTLSIVLRDKGTLKFVKYVSQSAKGDRYDITGSVEVEDSDDDDDMEDEEE